jgi:hypothetical protein
MTKPIRYEQLRDGEWIGIHVGREGFRDRCCDCGSVHVVHYRTDDSGGLQMKATSDKRATAAARKRLGITVTKKQGA